MIDRSCTNHEEGGFAMHEYVVFCDLSYSHKDDTDAWDLVKNNVNINYDFEGEELLTILDT